jgi:hypothetical protein
MFQKWDIKSQVKGTLETMKLEYNENNNWDDVHA